MLEISYIDLCGFRGYSEPTRINFSPDFNVISGRNGVGKSTLCDAIEYALTGGLFKYSDAKASGESVEDYIWWRGPNSIDECYVEVGFRDEDANLFSLRRTKGQYESPIDQSFVGRICNLDIAPPEPLIQLTKTSIIRDEFISALSLDLKETERFQLLRDALGSPDSDKEIHRANELKNVCARRSQEIDKQRQDSRASLKQINNRIEQLRARLTDDSAINSAMDHLRRFLGKDLPVDSLLPEGREAIAEAKKLIQLLEEIESELKKQESNTNALTEQQRRYDEVEKEIDSLKTQLEEKSSEYGEFLSKHNDGDNTEKANQISELLEAGSEIGLVDEHCPLCNAGHSQRSFEIGMQEVRLKIDRLNQEAQQLAKIKAEKKSAIRKSEIELEKKNTTLSEYRDALSKIQKSLERLDRLRNQAKLGQDVSAEDIGLKIDNEASKLRDAENALRILDTISLNSLLESSIREKEGVEKQVRELEARLAKARRAEGHAKALYDAARRAANEALDDRLDLIGPLLADLYRRLRPHTSWRDIDYKIRGDVKRFLKLEVGDGLNPQFIFSSGQRRATGLAFLLSVCLATSWSKFRTVLLDDPVQHIDDFRAVHLAEVLSTLSAEGNQVICAVEDQALAELLCRRLPSSYNSTGLHIRLGENERGALSVLDATEVTSSGTAILERHA